MQERNLLFAPPTMPEQVEMFSDSVREYIRFPRPVDINDDLKAAEFLVEEADTEATSLLVLSRYLAKETASLLAHLNSLEYLCARKPAFKNKGSSSAFRTSGNHITAIQPQ